MLEERRFLYQAVKYQVNEFFADHGYTMLEMWKLVRGDVTMMGANEMFWYCTCIDEYEEYLNNK